MRKEYGVGDTVSSPFFKPSEHPVPGGYWEKTNQRPVVWTVLPSQADNLPKPHNYLHAQHSIQED